MSAPFPCGKTVQWKSWSVGGKDGFGNDIDTWSNPKSVKVIGWSSRRIMSRDGVHEVEDTDHLRLLVPPNFPWNPKDLVTIPNRGDYEVVGVEDVGQGFHGWQPGLTLTLLISEG